MPKPKSRMSRREAERLIVESLPDDATYEVSWSYNEDDPESISSIKRILDDWYHPQGVSGFDDRGAYVGGLNKEEADELVKDLVKESLVDASGWTHDSVLANVSFTTDGKKWITAENWVDEHLDIPWGIL